MISHQYIFIPLVLFALITPAVYAGSPAEWRSRSIYQIVTDRFAQGASSQHYALPPNNQTSAIHAQNYDISQPPTPQCAQKVR
jgi:hypothetical protein